MPVPRAIEREHAVLSRERVDHDGLPVERSAERAVHEHDRRARAAVEHVQTRAVELDEAPRRGVAPLRVVHEHRGPESAECKRADEEPARHDAEAREAAVFRGRRRMRGRGA